MAPIRGPHTAEPDDQRELQVRADPRPSARIRTPWVTLDPSGES